jgi:hypothetical protein
MMLLGFGGIGVLTYRRQNLLFSRTPAAGPPFTEQHAVANVQSGLACRLLPATGTERAKPC